MPSTVVPEDRTLADMNGPLHYWGPAPTASRRLHPSDDLLLRGLQARLHVAGGDVNGIIPALASALAAASLTTSVA